MKPPSQGAALLAFAKYRALDARPPGLDAEWWARCCMPRTSPILLTDQV